MVTPLNEYQLRWLQLPCMFFHMTDSNEPVQPPQACVQSIYLLNLTSKSLPSSRTTNKRNAQTAKKLLQEEADWRLHSICLKKPNIHAFKPIEKQYYHNITNFWLWCLGKLLLRSLQRYEVMKEKTNYASLCLSQLA